MRTVLHGSRWFVPVLVISSLPTACAPPNPDSVVGKWKSDVDDDKPAAASTTGGSLAAAGGINPSGGASSSQAVPAQFDAQGYPIQQPKPNPATNAGSGASLFGAAPGNGNGDFLKSAGATMDLEFHADNTFSFNPPEGKHKNPLSGLGMLPLGGLPAMGSGIDIISGKYMAKGHTINMRLTKLFGLSLSRLDPSGQSNQEFVATLSKDGTKLTIVNAADAPNPNSPPGTQPAPNQAGHGPQATFSRH